MTCSPQERDMTYTPNFADPRVKRRIKRAMGFACSSLSDTRARRWARVELDRHFGTQNHDLSRWLRKQLLITANIHYDYQLGLCKSYRLNTEAVAYLSDIINDSRCINNTTIPNYPSVAQVQEIGLSWAKDTYGKEIQSGLFEYKDKSNRLWNDIQRLPTEIRRPLFAEQGYHWEYDIRACAPTLIYQHAKNQGLTKRTPTLNDFLADRQLYRQALAQTLNCTESQAKQIITALFSGAKIARGYAIDQILDHDSVKFDILKNNVWIKQLRKDIKRCWDAIKSSESSLRLRSRDKWHIYFQLERAVMSVVRTELNKQSIRYFLEHDGWRCDRHIDEYSLRLLVKKRTGYSVEFDCVRVTSDNTDV